MSQQAIRQEIRLQLLRASDRLRSAYLDLDTAIEQLDRGDFWDQAVSDAKINANVAGDQIERARGMAQVASLPTQVGAK
jgi:hypothetical protein